MLLKISLGLAILVGLATLYVTHVQVGGKITGLQGQLSSTQQELDVSRESERTLTDTNKTLRTALDTTSRNLNDATNLLNQATAEVQVQTDRANKAARDLESVTIDRNQAQQELAQWRAFELSVDQIRNNLARLRTLERDNTVLATDNTVMTRKISSLERELQRYRGDDLPDPVLPPGTKGNIVAVDPKYDFVVLDIGGNQGVVEDAKMMVNRDGKLIGKVKITSVDANRSIANVLPEWKQDEIMEGDQVIF